MQRAGDVPRLSRDGFARERLESEPETMQRFVRAAAQPLSQATIDEPNADELPRKVLVDVDMLDADELTIATGTVEWIVTSPARSSSRSR